VNNLRSGAYRARATVALAIGVNVGSLAVILLCGTPLSAASRVLDVNVLLSPSLVLLGSLVLTAELLSSIMGRERRGDSISVSASEQDRGRGLRRV
jgi:hypothetical protein